MYLKSLYPDLPDIPPQNLHHILFHRQDQREWTDYALLIDAATGGQMSYHEFYERVMDGATALGSPISKQGLGLNGGIVGILSENCMDYIVMLHSLLAITTPFALLSSYSTPFELIRALRLCNVTHIFVQPKYLSLVQRAAKDVGFPDSRIYILEGHVKGRQSFDEMIQHVRKEFTPRLAVRHAEKDTLAYLAFSSGTGGLPKAVMISHGNICCTIMQSIVLNIAKSQVNTLPVPRRPAAIPVILGFLPLHHSYGLLAFSFNLFFSKMTLVLMPKWDMDVALKVIPKYRIIHIPLIPSLVHQLVNSHKAKMADLSSLESAGSSAAYLPDSLKTELLNIVPKIEMGEGYGMSEMTIPALCKPFPGVLGGRVKSVPGSTGILMPGVEARILREDGTEAGLDEPGELWLRSGGVALGYRDNEQASHETFVDGWLKSGDRFTVDKDGTFYFQDRIKDTLKISGVQVSPTEIENVLLTHPAKLILDATVAGVLGGRTADEKIPRAWVVLTEDGKRMGEAAVVRALDAWTRDNLSKFKWLRGGIEVVNEISKSPTGKVLRKVLQDEYNQQMKSNSKL